MKRKNETKSNQNTGIKVKLLEIQAAGRTMRSKTTAAKDWIETLKTQLSDARMALEKLTEE